MTSPRPHRQAEDLCGSAYFDQEWQLAGGVREALVIPADPPKRPRHRHWTRQTMRHVYYHLRIERRRYERSRRCPRDRDDGDTRELAEMRRREGNRCGAAARHHGRLRREGPRVGEALMSARNWEIRGRGVLLRDSADARGSRR